MSTSQKNVVGGNYKAIRIGHLLRKRADVIDPVEAVNLVDENTIGICSILGVRYR